MAKKWEFEAPSNIALIKYMGKIDAQTNWPSNASISYTLKDLKTKVVIEESDSEGWEALVEKGYDSIELSEKGKKKFIDHWRFLQDVFSIKGQFKIKSANNFPSDCGLASSASSFAALTECAYLVAQEKGENNLEIDREKLAVLSRHGSGSSCRSFFEPWCEWEKDNVAKVDLAFNGLLHSVVIVDKGKKEVSSSEAHRRVTSSSLFQGRPERASQRLEELKRALSISTQHNWQRAYEICWEEFWDMHALFETSKPPFGYMRPGSIDAMNKIRDYWTERGDGPLVTMDAGANIHLLFRSEQKAVQKEIAQILGMYKVMSSEDFQK